MWRWFLVAVFCAVALSMQADIIHLASGGKVEAEILEETDDYILVRMYPNIPVSYTHLTLPTKA